MNNLTFGVREYLDQIATDREDGTPVIASAFYVAAQDETGRRWAHDHSYIDHVLAYDAEDGIRHWVRREDGTAGAAAARLLARIEAHVAAGGKLNAEHWNEIDPAYGSPAYQALDDLGYFAAHERQAARDAGEY